MSDELDFGSLDPISVPVTIGGRQYTLREAPLGTGIKYRDAHTTAAIVRDGIIIGSKGVAGIVPVVISDCLFDDTGKNVPIATISAWPDRVTSKLFTKIREISGFDDKETVEALEKRLAAAKAREARMGNSSASTTDASD